MRCPHCKTNNSNVLPFDRPVDGGQAYAQACATCGHILQIRPHAASDPPVMPPHLNGKEAARLRFLKWRLEQRSPDPADSPPHAA